MAGLLRLGAIAIPFGTPSENLRVQWRLFVLQKRPGPRLRNADPRLRSQINRWFGDASLLFVKPWRMSSCHRLVCLSVVAVAWAREAAIVTRFISDLGLEVDCTIKRGSKPARSGLSREQTRSITSESTRVES